ncbi:hypothetical protein DSCW_22510 [Desulfosarcina widdelii]|uniref:Bacterial surface antigen (D15) domain-containing protein n=1 Tax=Desulfosarcina widdelii TaxID=947919 RepID=A0A5K7Z8P3_9BACT|nr:hypothetical protein [Desulfosarcina widdelii]BBO74834.1 hypothetical protein DSCW_22510 [Desulfosarcina widdelii]
MRRKNTNHRWHRQTVVYRLLVIGLLLLLRTVALAADAAPSGAEKTLPVSSQTESQGSKAPDAGDKSRSSGKWLPLPIFLTEPAFGYGLGMALCYIHPHKEGVETEAMPSMHTPQSVASGRQGQKAPPDITGVAGGYTDNDTWFGAVGHSSSWRQDTIRYAGAATYADVKSTYYILDRPLDFDLKGFGILQDLKFRFGDTRFFLGGKLLYLETESTFDFTPDVDTGIAIGDISSENVGIAAALSFDGRDNVFTPNRGQLFDLTAWRYDEAFGGDYNYWSGNLKILSFHQLLPQLVLGLRLEGSAVDGRPPFYAYPWVTMRGIPALRYQGKRVGMAGVELRWDILARWAVLGFAGIGRVCGDDAAFETQDDIVSGGIGGRYLFMPDEGLWLGVDVARGPEDTYTYITVGQAW